jgi:MFS transporter, DHA2 family, multidrug resistance protein
MSALIPASNAGLDEPTLPTRHTGLLMAAVMAVSVCQFLDLTIANVALPHMQTSLGATMEQVSWIVTSFIIAGVLVLPLTGWLSDRLGSRNMFLWSTVAFVGASMLCGTATSLTQMCLYRAIQGIAAAFVSPMAQTIMFDISRPSKQAQSMAIWGIVVMIGPISGPFLGGYLTETLNWRWVFFVNVPIGIFAIVVLWWLLPSRPLVRRQLDIAGAVLLAIGLCATQLMLDRGQGKDWLDSTEIVIELLIALSAFWMFYVHVRSTANPLFDGQMIRDKNFLLGMVFMALMGITNIALSAVLPSLYQNIYRYDVMDTGLLMVPRGFGVLTTMMISNKIMSRVDNRMMITVGYLIAAWSMWVMTSWSLDMGRDWIIIASVVQGLGLGLVFVPMNMIAFGTLSAEHRTEGTTLLTLARNLGSSIGLSLIVTMIAKNIQTSHADIGAHVTQESLPAMDVGAVAERLGSLGGGLLAIIDGEVNRQAAMIAYIDNFYMMFWLLILVAPLPWLVKRPGLMGMPQKKG